MTKEVCPKPEPGSQWGITVLVGSFALHLNSVIESVVAPDD